MGLLPLVPVLGETLLVHYVALQNNGIRLDLYCPLFYFLPRLHLILHVYVWQSMYFSISTAFARLPPCAWAFRLDDAGYSLCPCSQGSLAFTRRVAYYGAFCDRVAWYTSVVEVVLSTGPVDGSASVHLS